MEAIVSGVDFNAIEDSAFTKAKINNNGRKQIGILNGKSMKSLYMTTPLMLTWGVNEYNDEGKLSYDMALQFPRDEYNNENCVKFLKNMQDFETKIKQAAIENSREWLNKSRLTPDAVDALWSPMLKYPKDRETGDPDYSRPPTLKIKLQYWEGEFKNIEIYNENREPLYPVNDGEDDLKTIQELIVKGSNIATIIQCGGIWVANGKFGVTWKLFQAVVKPRVSLKGTCHIELSSKDIEQLKVKCDDSDNESSTVAVVNTMVEDSDNDEQVDNKEDVKEQVKEEVKEAVKQVEVEDQPKKKKVVKKKPVATTANE